MRRTVAVVGLVMTAGLAGACADRADRADGSPGDEWLQWRGPGGLGISNRAGLPVAWDQDGTGIKWSAPIDGFGTSSPIVARGEVFLTSAKESDEGLALQVHAFDLASGESLWQTAVAHRQRERRHRVNSSAGPTPVTDGTTVFAYFGSHLAALDREGKAIWVQEIDPNYVEESRYGAGTSPILYEDLVILLRDREYLKDNLIGWIAAYDKTTGEVVWRRQWQDSCCSYTTPLVVEDGSGGEELFVVLAGYVVALDPRTGEELRRADQVIAQPVASPVLEEDLICVASGAHSYREVGCWQVVEEAGETSWDLLWKFAKWVPDSSSPILQGGRLYMVTEQGVMRCLDARTGKPKWRLRLEDPPYRASLVAGGGNLYALGGTGAVAVVSMEDGSIVSENRLSESPYVASPAIAGDCILFRGADALHCVVGADQGREKGK